MGSNPFIEREDKPEYLLVGKSDSIEGYDVYVNSKRFFEVLRNALDTVEFTKVNRQIQQEIMDAVYGKGVIDLDRDVTYGRIG